MRVTAEGLTFLHEAEACRLEAYRDSGGLPTIGWGTVRYPPWHLGGRKVQMGDRCSQTEADQFFRHDLQRIEDAVDALTTDAITPRQFNALVSLVYNIGEAGYRSSTVRRLVNAEPGDARIREAWMRWHFDNGVRVRGLWIRRWREADFYFGVTTVRPVFPGDTT